MATRHEPDSLWGDCATANLGEINISLSTTSLSIGEATDFVKDEKGGAVILFAGTTRDHFEGKSVKLLSYEAHKGLALRTLRKIAKEAQKQFKNTERQGEIHRIYISHRLGDVPVKEESIIIALSSTYRNEGWEAAIWILEQIKELAEIWKLEQYEDGEASWKQNKT